jgi:hypothetical protein
MSLHKHPADSPPFKRSVFIYPRFPQALAVSEAESAYLISKLFVGCASGQERRRASYIPPTERLARLQATAGFAGFAVEATGCRQRA